ncbi:MAG: lipoprotein [Hyphomicrobiaceae bacterium]
MRMRLALLIMIASLGVAGCGVRGSLEYPPEARAEPAAQAEEGQGREKGAAGKPHRDFLLDGLLR